MFWFCDFHLIFAEGQTLALCPWPRQLKHLTIWRQNTGLINIIYQQNFVKAYAPAELSNLRLFESHHGIKSVGAYTYIACEYSRLSSLPAGSAFRERDVSPRVSHVVAGASERRLYSQANTYINLTFRFTICSYTFNGYLCLVLNIIV